MTQEPEILYCANHPSVATGLRCNRCEKPICSKCATLTPTGYRCKQCISGQLKVFETAKLQDYVLAFILAAILSLIGSIVIAFLPFALLTFLVAPVVGTIIGEAIRLATGKRRSRKLHLGVVGAMIVGAIPLVLIELISLGFFSYQGGVSGFASGLLPLVWQGVYLFLSISSAYYRLAGITIRY
jgi:uncharacterized protein YqgC (DUF456 family)